MKKFGIIWKKPCSSFAQFSICQYLQQARPFNRELKRINEKKLQNGTNFWLSIRIGYE